MSNADLDLRKLRYFITVAEELNFGRAATRLHIAQPVLSRQIRVLEEELGLTLLIRDSRGSTLTAAGLRLLDEARFLLADVVLPVDDPLAARQSVSLVDLASRCLLQNPASVPEWYAVASPELRREAVRSSVNGVEQKLELVAARAGFAVLPRSTTMFYRRP